MEFRYCDGMRKTILLHKDIYIPPWVQPTVGKTLSQYKSYALSKHVLDHAAKDGDRSHGYTLAKLNQALANALGKRFEAFEVELTRFNTSHRWVVTKVCIRIPYGSNQDACLSIRTYRDRQTNKLDCSKGLLVTAWLNCKDDCHATLDMGKYASKEDYLRLSK